MTYLEKIEEKGIEKGIEQGIEQGRLVGKLEDARLMKGYGDPLDKILKITGLSESQLRENGIV
jgi:predicted transposase/invertase (TIGR01784 family)